MIAYETLLDLAQQRLADIAARPNHTRDARHVALRLHREVVAELEAANSGNPHRALVQAYFTDERKAA
jgi:hypothetical protein